MKKRLLVTEPESYEPHNFSLLSRVFDVQIAAPQTQIELIAAFSDFQPDIALIGLGLSIRVEEMEAVPNLRVIASPTTGSDHIDLRSARERKVEVITLFDIQRDLSSVSSTAELALGLLLNLARPIIAATSAVGAGNWRRNDFRGMQLQGKTLGIVGLGRLGGIMADYGNALKMKVIAVDPAPKSPREFVEIKLLDEVLCLSDVLSLHVPLNDQTKYLLNGDALAKTKKGVLLVNTSRGDVIDELKLADQIRAGHIAGYGTDVISGDTSWGGRVLENPITPLMDEGFRVVVTPHIGGYTEEAIQYTHQLMIEHIVKMFSQM